MLTHLKKFLILLLCLGSLSAGPQLIDLTQAVEHKEQEDCDICFDRKQDTQLVCSHSFCQVCIADIIQRSTISQPATCPLCRAPLVIKQPATCVFCKEPITQQDSQELPCTIKGHQAHRDCLINNHPHDKGICPDCNSPFTLKTKLEPAAELSNKHSDNTLQKNADTFDNTQVPTQKKDTLETSNKTHQIMKHFIRASILGTFTSYSFINYRTQWKTGFIALAATVLFSPTNKTLNRFYAGGFACGWLMGAVLAKTK